MAKKTRQIEITEQQVLEGFKNEQLKMDSLRKAGEGIQGSVAETLAARDALKEISLAKKGEKIFVFLGAGVFAEASIEKTSKVRQTLGAGVVIEEGIEKVLENLEKMRAENEKKLGAVQQEQNKTLANLQGLGSLIAEAQRLRRQKPQL